MIQQFIRFIYRLMKKEKVPLVFVIGPTGVGKTKLSIELAKHFATEVISADSMQLYKDLDIITNKATEQEKQGIPHHLIDFADPLCPFTVVDYRNRALPIIHRILKGHKIPIIAGGTMYYVESLLYEILVEADKQGDILVNDEDDEVMRGMIDSGNILSDSITVEDLFARPIIPRALKNVPSHVLHSILTSVDPEMSNQLPSNSKRKIIRSLQIYQKTGRKHSDWIKEQKSMKGGNRYGGPLRYPNSIILYLTCDEEVHNKRLDDRVDQMIEQGLIDELTKFHENYNLTRLEQKQTADYTEGIFQSIGFKEFHDYLMLDSDERRTENGIELLNSSIERLKLVTRRYARRQKKWIKNRFINATDRPTPDIFELNTTDLTQWDDQVRDKAIEIVNLFSQYQPYPTNSMPLRESSFI